MDQKETYVERVQQQLDAWNREIESLKRKAEEASGEAEKEYRAYVEDLQHKELELRARLDEVQKANERAWRDMKEGADKAWKDMETAFNQAFNRFN